LFSVLQDYADHISQAYNGLEGHLKTSKSLVDCEHGEDITH
jgi:hypothetical protein